MNAVWITVGMGTPAFLYVVGLIVAEARAQHRERREMAARWANGWLVYTPGGPVGEGRVAGENRRAA